MNFKSLFVIALLSSLFLFAATIPNTGQWEFWKEKEGVRVFTRVSAGSKIRELKMETIFKGSIASFVAILDDVDSYGRWIYSSTDAYTVQDISETEQIYYGKSDFPWPMNDRDFVVYNKIWQDASTLAFHSLSVDYQHKDAPPNEGIVRVSALHSKWSLTPIAKNTFELVYTVKSNPGGNIPAWAINMMLDVGPFKTLKNLQKEVEKPKYKNATFDYIIEPVY